MEHVRRSRCQYGAQAGAREGQVTLRWMAWVCSVIFPGQYEALDVARGGRFTLPWMP